MGVTSVRIHEALTDKMVELIHSDPALAERALENHFGSIGRRQENKEAVVALALEDLSNSPPNDDQNASGPETLDEAFLNRFERFAEDATSEQLRERWGRVLAAEIRQPGTFSAKVMRVVDELDASTASLFEKICESRIGGTIICPLLEDISYTDQKRLVTSGLIVDPGSLGQACHGQNINTPPNEYMKAIRFDSFGLAILDTSPFDTPGTPEIVIEPKERPAVKVWMLTDAGHSIASILKSEERKALSKLADLVAEQFRPRQVQELWFQGPGPAMCIRQTSRPLDNHAS